MNHTSKNDKNVFWKHQFGYLKRNPATDAHFPVNYFIHENLYLNLKIMGIFLDVKKTFDRVNNNVLLRKLNYAGI